MAIGVVIILFLFGFTGIFFFYVLSKYKELKDNKVILGGGLFLILFLILLGLTTIRIFGDLSDSKDLTELAQHGDYVGGMLNPLIAVFAVFAAGFAFYAQYQANKQIQEQFKIQQFESQFYEMLRLHKENVNEIGIEVLDFEYQGIDGVGNNGQYNPVKKKVNGRDVFIYFENELEIAFKSYLKYVEDNKIECFDFELPYKAFFNGIHYDENPYFIHLENDKKQFEYLYFSKNNDTPFIDVNVKSKYRLFQGHENSLGHYYRHLFHTVKFITEQDSSFISYKEKRKYLRLLRAQLSNYEQAMLFYNYLAYAREWEEKNHFFTNYRMIHNLYENVLFDHEVFKLEYNNLKLKQDTALCYKDNDHIFESQRWEGNKKIICKSNLKN